MDRTVRNNELRQMIEGATEEAKYGLTIPAVILPD